MRHCLEALCLWRIADCGKKLLSEATLQSLQLWTAPDDGLDSACEY